MDNKPAALPAGSGNTNEDKRDTPRPQPVEEQQTDQGGNNASAVVDLPQQQMLLLALQMQPRQGRAAEDFGFGGADPSVVFQSSQAQQLLQQPIGPISMNQDAAVSSFNFANQSTRDQQAPLNQVAVATQDPFTTQVSSSEPSHNSDGEFPLAVKNPQLLSNNNETIVSSAPGQEQLGGAQHIVAAPTNAVFAASSSTTSNVDEIADPLSAFSPRPLNPSAVRISAPQSFQQQLTSFNPSLLTQALSNFEVGRSIQGGALGTIHGSSESSVAPQTQTQPQRPQLLFRSHLSTLPQVHLVHQQKQLNQQQLNQQQLQQQQQQQLQQQQQHQPQQQQEQQEVQSQQGGPANQEVAPKKQKRIYRHESFPEKLHRMLLELEAQGKDDIASFIGEGNAFQIHQPTAFEEQIIPVYFRHSKLASFKRQLSMYGFQRITGGTEHGSYTHAMFLKNRPDLCKQMDRVS